MDGRWVGGLGGAGGGGLAVLFVRLGYFAGVKGRIYMRSSARASRSVAESMRRWIWSLENFSASISIKIFDYVCSMVI